MAVDEALRDWVARASDFVDTLGLDPFPVEFEVVPADALYEIAAYGTVNHWHHWSYGRDYWVVKQQMEHGMTRLYEVVLNANPAIAYLLESNSAAQNGLVAAHVAGHSHVYKHNRAFAHTRRDMPMWFAMASERMRGYEERYGIQKVERFLDLAMSLKNQVSLTDPGDVPASVKRTEYGDLLGGKPRPPEEKRLWVLPDLDILRFLGRYGPFLEDWQRDVLDMVRAEALYFYPQRLVSIVHEGFATWVHEKALAVLPKTWRDAVDMTLLHASVVARPPLELNRYWLGWRLLQLIERDHGKAAVLQVAADENDASFLRNWLVPDYVRELELFQYHWQVSGPELHQIRDLTAEEVLRDVLANGLGRREPNVYVADVRRDYTLVLRHDVLEDAELDKTWAGLTLRAVAAIWGARVELQRKGAVTWQVEPE